MSGVKRYDCEFGLDEHMQECVTMDECTDGEYVRFLDYQEVMLQLGIAKSKIAELERSQSDNMWKESFRSGHK